MRLVAHCTDGRTVPCTAARVGAPPAALVRPLPPAALIAEHCWDCRLPLTRRARIAKRTEPTGRQDGERRLMRRFLWISLGRARFSSPCSYWPSLVLHSKSWSQSRSKSCRPETFILLSFWNLIFVVFQFGVGKKYGSIVCAWICTLDLSTPSCQHTHTIHSKSTWFIAHLPEILPLWTLPGIIIIVIIVTAAILGLQYTPLLTHGSQPSALVPLHKWTVAPFSSHLATASPWTNRSSSVHAHPAFGPGHPQLQHQHLASHCSLLSSVTCCLFSHSHLVLCKHFIRNKSIYVCLYRQMPKPVLVTIMPTGIKERTVGLGLLIKRWRLMLI